MIELAIPSVDEGFCVYGGKLPLQPIVNESGDLVAILTPFSKRKNENKGFGATPYYTLPVWVVHEIIAGYGSIYVGQMEIGGMII